MAFCGIRRGRRKVQVQLDRPQSRSRNMLLAALPANDFALLAPYLKGCALEQGAVLQEQGEPINQVYFPHDGIVSLLAVMRHGDAVETATVGYEGAVGGFAGLGVRRSHTRAIVQVSGAALRIGAAHLRSAAKHSQAVRESILRYGEILLIQVQQTAACNALHTVEARLGRWLLQTHDRLDTDTFRLTHDFLAQMLGVRRTTVTVIANVLQQAGLIRYHRGRIEIVDRMGLEARACECYEAIRRQIDEVSPATAR
jgi:CRP-like cAMP-binding protein